MFCDRLIARRWNLVMTPFRKQYIYFLPRQRLLVPQVHKAPINTHSHSTSSNPSVSDLAPSWTPDSNISDLTQIIVFLNSEFSTQGFFFFPQRMKCDAPVTSLSSLHLHSENLILTYIFPQKCHCLCEIWAPFLYREQWSDWMS